MLKLKWWQKALSLLVDVPVQQQRSIINGTIYISRYRGAWMVATDHAVRGWGLNYQPFKTAFEFLEIWQRPVKSVLLLGAGTGSVIELLTRHGQEFEFTVSESDPVFQDLAASFLAKNLQDQLEWHQTCAKIMLGATTARYDLIVVDELVKELPPQNICTQSFVEQLKAHLLPGGHVLFHHPSGKHRLKQATNALYSGPFTKVFPHAVKRAIGDSTVLIAQAPTAST